MRNLKRHLIDVGLESLVFRRPWRHDFSDNQLDSRPFDIKIGFLARAQCTPLMDFCTILAHILGSFSVKLNFEAQ